MTNAVHEQKGNAHRHGSADIDDEELGRRLRGLRAGRGLSLKEVADQAGLSIGLLSQIERGLSSPSIRALRSLCQALDVPMSVLFEAADDVPPLEAKRIVRAGRRRRLDFGSRGMIKELLTPPSSELLQVMEVHLESGAGSGDVPYTHEGEEAGVVTEGRVEIEIDGVAYVLDEGDAFQFTSTLPHRFRNIGTSPARILWIVSPPFY